MALLDMMDEQASVLDEGFVVVAGILAVDQPIDVRLGMPGGRALERQGIALIGQSRIGAAQDARSLEHAELDHVHEHGRNAVVQATDIGALVLRPDVRDLQSVGEHTTPVVVDVGHIRTAPDGAGPRRSDTRAFQDNCFAGPSGHLRGRLLEQEVRRSAIRIVDAQVDHLRQPQLHAGDGIRRRAGVVARILGTDRVEDQRAGGAWQQLRLRQLLAVPIEAPNGRRTGADRAAAQQHTVLGRHAPAHRMPAHARIVDGDGDEREAGGRRGDRTGPIPGDALVVAQRLGVHIDAQLPGALLVAAGHIVAGSRSQVAVRLAAARPEAPLQAIRLQVQLTLKHHLVPLGRDRRLGCPFDVDAEHVARVAVAVAAATTGYEVAEHRQQPRHRGDPSTHLCSTRREREEGRVGERERLGESERNES